ncbi:MAG: hypothetical protein CBC05_08380 [Crocinitomicaceae bacterium TMED45]|nr:MAG: hypothetical protein CBC05_08380 [Crocinitomicaceae bacterium TMED45]
MAQLWVLIKLLLLIVVKSGYLPIMISLLLLEEYKTALPLALNLVSQYLLKIPIIQEARVCLLVILQAQQPLTLAGLKRIGIQMEPKFLLLCAVNFLVYL